MLCRGDRPMPLRASFHGLYPLLTGIFSKVHEGECQPPGTEPAGMEAWERGLGPGETHPILPADPGNRAVKLGGVPAESVLWDGSKGQERILNQFGCLGGYRR